MASRLLVGFSAFLAGVRRHWRVLLPSSLQFIVEVGEEVLQEIRNQPAERLREIAGALSEPGIASGDRDAALSRLVGELENFSLEEKSYNPEALAGELLERVRFGEERLDGWVFRLAKAYFEWALEVRFLELGPEVLARHERRLADLERELRQELKALEDRAYARAVENAVWFPRGPRARELGLLAVTAKYGVVPFQKVAAFGELLDMVERVKRENKVMLLTLYGQGGAGKTRLALELAAELGRRGWFAGFLRSGSDFTLGDLEQIFEKPAPKLFVVDYAAYRREDVDRLLSAAAGKGWRGPLLVLLLERSRLRYPEELATGISDDKYQGRPQWCWERGCAFGGRELGELSEGEARALYRAAFRALSAFAGGARDPGEELVAEVAGRYRRPLALALDALVRLASDEEPERAEALYDQALREEIRGRWFRRLDKERRLSELEREAAERGLRLGAALATLLGGVAVRELRRELKENLDYLDGREGLVGELADALAEVLPGFEPGAVAPLEPDPVADRLFLDEELRSRAIAGAVRAVVNAEGLDGEGRLARLERVYAVLARAFDSGEAATHVLAGVLGDFLETPVFKDLLNRAKEANPNRPLLVSPVYAGVLQAALLREENEAELARLKGSLGNVFVAYGQREQALQATKEAVELFRGLTEGDPKFLPDLAASLNNLGAMLSALGRREEALQATKEAIELFRGLVEGDPKFLPDLAASLNNLGAMLSALGRREEALKATEEAARLYRELAAKSPEAFLPDLAASLNNLGRVLSALGRREEAFKAAEEAVKIRRELAARNPDAYLPDLARSLNNLGKVLSELGRRAEALKATEEAVEIRRELAAKSPEAFLPDLATSLGLKSHVLRALERYEEAAASAKEGLQKLQGHFLRYPQAFGGLMSALVGVYFEALSRLGRGPDPALLCPLLEAREALAPELVSFLGKVCRKA